VADTIKGRGTALQPNNRFAACATEPGFFADLEYSVGTELEPVDTIETILRPDRAKKILTRNSSPDVHFEQSINPYQGCEHGCVYCYARPSHAYYGLSAGLDFETQVFYKANAAQLLSQELARPGYQCRSIMLGANTDPWQPAESRLRITRSILEVLVQTRHPVSVITKGIGIERDIDLLADLARDGLANAFVSLPTLDNQLKRNLEPRAASPNARLRMIEKLTGAGIPVGVMLAPIIPALNDSEIESTLEAARQAGARRAAYVVLRLPYEVKDLFRDWLSAHYPERAAHIMAIVQDMRGGRDNDSRFGLRMRGQGRFADMIRQRFSLACRRLGFDTERGTSALRTDLFQPPRAPEPQLSLW
jgi:DNA repair photolyase